ncbi:MAG: signal recognition particle-docking protein FtsY [Gammaproteobacteria bacterium]|nr:signal recognition particle-docking protein FtsY [Gammaproteobacteria bacterium]
MFPNPTPLTDSNPDSLFKRLKAGLARTRAGLAALWSSSSVDNTSIDALETALLRADVGIEVTALIVEQLRQTAKQQPQIDMRACVTAQMLRILTPSTPPLTLPTSDKPCSILIVGVNGVGKTTTVGKLAKQFQTQGCSVMLAAGDTFRAAAVEQLQTWGERNQVPVIAQTMGADSAAVIYDAMQAAQARCTDVLLADTAGRLHTKSNLMEELKKVKRTMARQNPHAPHQVWLVLDAGTGQNALQQAEQFHNAVGVNGVIITKLDGTAKGGMVLAIAHKLQLPIRYIGTGEAIDDLRRFNAEEFVHALLDPA